MTNKWSDKVEEIIIGIDESYNFMNYAVPSDPQPLRLSVTEATTIEFSFTKDLMRAGWLFQETPFAVRNDYGVNFSSYGWMDNEFEGEKVEFSKFKVMFECIRLGEYEYSLFMRDRRGQKITLDPKIENGAGW